MSNLVDVQDENDVVWTMSSGVLLAWQVQNGIPTMVSAVDALRTVGERLPSLQPQEEMGQ